jgi:hypothetical protein
MYLSFDNDFRLSRRKRLIVIIDEPRDETANVNKSVIIIPSAYVLIIGGEKNNNHKLCNGALII